LDGNDEESSVTHGQAGCEPDSGSAAHRALHATRLLGAARRERFDLVVIGSPATGRFSLRSDVDILVRGEADGKTRVRIEQLVAAATRGSGIRCDLISPPT